MWLGKLGKIVPERIGVWTWQLGTPEYLILKLSLDISGGQGRGSTYYYLFEEYPFCFTCRSTGPMFFLPGVWLV